MTKCPLLRLKNPVLLLTLTYLLTACGGGGGSSNDDDATPPDTPPPPPPPAENVVGLKVPDQLDVIVTNSNGGSGKTNAAAAKQPFDDPNSDYSKAEQRFHVWHSALEPVESVNNILCFIGQLRADALVNTPPYTALVDEKRCESGGSGGGDPQAESAEQSEQYVTAIVKSERSSNTSAMTVSVWLPQMNVAGDMPGQIRARATVDEGASNDNPFGRFTLTYEMQPQGAPQAIGGGELKAQAVDNDHIGFTLFESAGAAHDGFSFSDQRQAVVTVSKDKTTGNGITAFNRQGNGPHGSFAESGAFGLSYNSSNLKVQHADTVAHLPFIGGNQTDGMCLDRNRFKQAVWRYGLYDATSGAEITLNSGFGFRYDSNGDSTLDAFGHVGYWGLWTENRDAMPANGSTIVARTPGSNSEQSYTLLRSPGKLVHYVAATLPLSQLSGIDMYYWTPELNDPNQNPEHYQQWLVNYLTSSERSGFDGASFYIVAGVRFGDNGPSTTALTTISKIVVSENHSLHMHSQQLGGNVNYAYGDDKIVYFKESTMFGNETANGELFAGGSADLLCFNQCLKAGLTANDLSTFDGVFVQPPPTAPLTYRISNGGDMAMTLTLNGAAVTTGNLTEDQLHNTMFQWGVRSGPLVTATVAALIHNPWDIYNPAIVSEYYQWETGPNQWNQLTRVRDANNTIVRFDRPLQFSYVHSDANDRNHDAGAYDNQTVLLNYGGHGELWGIPHINACEGDESCNGRERWYPAFNIADATLMGPNHEYVVKALEGEQKMSAATDASACQALTISNQTLPTAITGQVNIGAMPTVNGAPKVIGGVIQP